MALSQLADAEPSTSASFLAAAATIPPKPFVSLRYCLSSRLTSQELHAFVRATLVDMLRCAVRRGGGTISPQNLVSTLNTQCAQSAAAKL